MIPHPLTQHQQDIARVARKNGITYLGLFGSYARGEQSAGSDIDLLVNFDPKLRLSLFDLIDIENELSHALSAPVDLIPSDSLNKYVRPYAEQDLVTIYGQR